MGAIPETYSWVRAAKYLGVPVWELIERADGLFWKAQAVALENAETLAQQDLSKHHGR
jgi:hypothetical protein